MKRLIPLLLAACALPAGAATFTVTSVADSGAGSLREQMIAANAAAGNSHRIQFSPSLVAGSTIELSSPLPTITKAGLEIDGPGIIIEPLQPFNSHRFLVGSSNVLTLTLRGLTLSGGLATSTGTGGGCLDGSAVSAGASLLLDRVTFRSCLSAFNDFSRGGAVQWNGESLVIENSVFENNAAASIGTAGTSQASGGAVYGVGVVNVSRSRFTDQIVNGKFTFGGAINALSGLIVTDSVFINNTAVPEALSGAFGSGGAVALDCQTCLMRIERSFFGDNSSQSGSAVFVRGNVAQTPVPVTLKNVSFSNNASAAGQGGALMAVRSSITADQLSFQGNSGTGAHLLLLSSTLPALRNSVFGSSTGTACSSPAAQQSIGNIVSDASCETMLAGSTRNDGLAAATVNVNESMPVIAWPINSPVIDAGDDATCLAVDTRNTTRPQDGNNDGQSRCDAGAYERTGINIFKNGFEG